MLNQAKLAHPPCAATKTPINMHTLVDTQTGTQFKCTNMQDSFSYTLIFCCVPGTDVPELERAVESLVIVSMTHCQEQRRCFWHNFADFQEIVHRYLLCNS